MPTTKSPQELINQFWERIVSHGTDLSITTTLPQSIFAQGFRDQVRKEPGVAENVMADYGRAVESCVAKVNKISKECRVWNQKYKDPSFNLSNYGYCLRPLTTYVPPEKDTKATDEFVDHPPAPPRMTLLVDDKPGINLTNLIADREESVGHVEESPGAQPQSIKRVRQIFDKPEFFVDGATADDIRQGYVGDCWFLSALSALCSMEAVELGNLVERICVKRDEAVGVYGFVFYRDGEWRSEVVDDTLYLTAPDYKHLGSSSEMDYLLKYIKEKDRAEQYRKVVQSNSEALYYARSAHKNETWVPLIEKAYAKAHGDYTAIEDGLTGEGIEDLTGGLSTFFFSDDIVDLDKFWDEGLARVNKSFLWGCSTSMVNEQDKRGILGMHAYSILEAQTIPDGTRLLKVRNPWGESEWEGDWSDRSKNWTDELRKLLKHEDKDDGIFWISYKDLLTNYPYLHRTRIFDASWTVAQYWTNFTVPLLSSDIYERTFKFTLSKAATTAVVLSQLDERYFRGLTGQHTFGLSFQLHQLDDDDYLYRCHHRHFDDRSINLEIDLEAGVYEVRLRITSGRDANKPKVDDVVRINWKNSREKLLQICRSYDLAHARVAAPELKIRDVQAEKAIAEPNPEVKIAEPQPAIESDGATVSNVGDHKTETTPVRSDRGEGAETKPCKPVDGDKPHVQDGSTASKPEEETKMKESKQTSEDGQLGSAVLVTNEDHKSDTDTTSTEPELINRSDLKPESGSEGKGPKTEGHVEGEESKSGDGAAQSLHNESVTAEQQLSTTPSTLQAGHITRSEPGDAGVEEQGNTAKGPQVATIDRRETHTAAEKEKDSEKDNQEKEKEKDSEKDNQEKEKEKDSEKDNQQKEKDDDESKREIRTYPEPGAAAEREDEAYDKEHKPDEDFNSVCTVGLLVYCRDAEARIELISPSTALVRNKQFTSSKQVNLDVDDPAKR